jgi:hypothetical protein
MIRSLNFCRALERLSLRGYTFIIPESDLKVLANKLFDLNSNLKYIRLNRYWWKKCKVSKINKKFS